MSVKATDRVHPVSVAVSGKIEEIALTKPKKKTVVREEDVDSDGPLPPDPARNDDVVQDTKQNLDLTNLVFVANGLKNKESKDALYDFQRPVNSSSQQ